MLKIVGVNIAVLLGLSLIVEVIFGNWFWGADYGMLDIPRDIDRTFDVSALYGGADPIRYTVDAHGLRGDYDDLSDIDILTIGGSTTNQLFIDNAATWQAHLRSMFRKAGHDVTIVNAGMEGQSSVGHLAIFDLWFPNVPGLSADYVLAYVGINDMALQEDAKWDRMQNPEPAERVVDYIKNKSALYRLYRVVKGNIRARDAQLVHAATTPDHRHGWLPLSSLPSLANRQQSAERHDIERYEARLVALARRIRAFGAEPILVTQPSTDYRLRQGELYLPARPAGSEGEDAAAITQPFLELDAFNRATMRACRTADAICIDLADEAVFKDGDFYDRIHNTPSGTKKVAEVMFRHLAPVIGPTPDAN